MKKYVITDNKCYLWISISVIIVLFPVVLQFIFFPSQVPSNISNEAWASFFGSYIGGIFGGVGTIWAVLISTGQTEKIQKENNENDNKKYMDHRVEIFNQRNADRENVMIQLRESFCNDIVSTMGKYYSDINKYATLARRIGESYSADRSISIQCHFILHSRLDGIDSAKPLLEKLDYIHRISGDENVILINFFKESKMLLRETTNFVNNYSILGN